MLSIDRWPVNVSQATSSGKSHANQPNGFCFEPFAEPTQPCMFEASYDVRNRVDPCHTTSAFACIWLPFVQDVGPKRQPTAIACLRTHLQTQCLNYDVVGLIFVCGALCVRQGPLHLDAFACVCPASLRALCGSARSPYVPSTPSRHVKISSRCWRSVWGWKSGHILCLSPDHAHDIFVGCAPDDHGHLSQLPRLAYASRFLRLHVSTVSVALTRLSSTVQTPASCVRCVWRCCNVRRGCVQDRFQKVLENPRGIWHIEESPRVFQGRHSRSSSSSTVLAPSCTCTAPTQQYI